MAKSKSKTNSPAGKKPPLAPAAAPREVRVLSIHQPWCDLILAGTKPVENRTWSTPYRGRIYIHASKFSRPPTREQLIKDSACDEFADAVLSLWDEPGDRQTGAILGSVDLVDILPFDLVDEISSISGFENRLLADCSDELCKKFSLSPDRLERVWKLTANQEEARLYALWSGPECWILERPKRLAKPIPTAGKLNLWKFMLPAGAD